MVFKLNPQQLVSRLSYAKHKYFHTFSRYSNSLADLVMLGNLITKACMRLKRNKILKYIAHY